MRQVDRDIQVTKSTGDGSIDVAACLIEGLPRDGYGAHERHDKRPLRANRHISRDELLIRVDDDGKHIVWAENVETRAYDRVEGGLADGPQSER